MFKKLIVSGLLILVIIIAAQPAESLSGKGIVQLKKAGVSDRTIQVIIQEKVIETAAFSIDEIVEMKQAGVGETTLQMLVKEGSFLNHSRVIVYGTGTRPIRFTTARDVIELKKAGLSDEVIQAIIAVTGEKYYSEREEAYSLLRGMGIVVDNRGYRREEQH
jgi:hypothetical protein